MRRSYAMFAIDRLLPGLIVNRFKSRSRLNAQSVVSHHRLSDLRVRSVART